MLSRTGETLQFSSAKYRRLSVYSLETLELSLGDQGCIPRNDPKLQINNGGLRPFLIKGPFHEYAMKPISRSKLPRVMLWDRIKTAFFEVH